MVEEGVSKGGERVSLTALNESNLSMKGLIRNF